MRVALVALVVLFGADLYATDWATALTKVRDSVVQLTYRGGGGCSGFVINQAKNYVLTAKHCNADLIYVDKIPATVVAVDNHQDLMVLEVKDLGRKALRLAAKDAQVGQEVASYGYGYALMRPMFRVATISDVNAKVPEYPQAGPFVMVDAAFVGGQSGAPTVNAAGEVVMMVQFGSNLVGFGVGAEILNDRMGRYFEKPAP